MRPEREAPETGKSRDFFTRPDMPPTRFGGPGRERRTWGPPSGTEEIPRVTEVGPAHVLPLPLNGCRETRPCRSSDPGHACWRQRRELGSAPSADAGSAAVDPRCGCEVAGEAGTYAKQEGSDCAQRPRRQGRQRGRDQPEIGSPRRRRPPGQSAVAFGVTAPALDHGLRDAALLFCPPRPATSSTWSQRRGRCG